MPRLNRVLLIILIGVLWLWMAGCSSTPLPTPPPPATGVAGTGIPSGPIPTAQATNTPQPQIAITYWEDESDDGDVLLDELTAAFARAHPRIKVTRVHLSPEELRDRFQTADPAATKPELIRAESAFAGPFGELGLLRPITETLDAAQLAPFFPGALEAATVRGTLWGVPDYYGDHLMLIYNRDLVTQVPADTDAWIAQLRQLSNPAQGRYGLVYHLTEPFWFIPWLAGFGGWPLDAGDNPTLATPAMSKALQFVYNLKFIHKVVPPEANYNTAYDLFKQGKAAYIIDGGWNLARYRQVGLKVGVTALPRVAETGQYPAPMASGNHWFISHTADGARLEAAAQFVAFMTSPQAQAEWLAKMERLPSHREVAASPRIAGDPILAGAVDQLGKTRGLPPAPEMRCAWQGMARYLAPVMEGKLAPADAPRPMQAEAEACVEEMRSAVTPSK